MGAAGRGAATIGRDGAMNRDCEIGGQPVAADALAGARRPVTSLKLPGAAASGLLGGGE